MGDSTLKKSLLNNWNFIERIARSSDAASVEDCLLEVASSFGFSGAFGGIVPTRRLNRSETDARIMLQRLPLEWTRRYNDKGYVFRDPIVHRLQMDREPFTWTDAYSSCRCRDDVKVISGEASEFGLRQGYVIPIMMVDGTICAISFAGECVAIDEDERSALSFASNYAVGQFLHQRFDQVSLRRKVTAREFDCLLWASEGKTDWEISVILGISRATVIKHIASAREKLGAVNKSHAIAMALRIKLLR